MARKDARPDVSRRKFLAGVAVAGAATTVTTGAQGHARRDREQAAALGGHAQHAADRCRDRRIARADDADSGPSGVGLHGRRHQVDEDRIHLFESGIELPRPARVADQLRQEHHAGVPDRHARRSVGGDVPRPLQGDRQAADGAHARHRRPAARRHGGVQRLGRPRAGDHDRRQRSRRLQASAGRADGSLRAGHQRAGARLHQVGRPAGLAASISRSRSCAPTNTR